MSESPDPPAGLSKGDRARRRAIYTAVVIAVFCATVIPELLERWFGTPVIGGFVVALGFYLLFNRIFRFDPGCPTCKNKVTHSATKCRFCGAALNPH